MTRPIVEIDLPAESNAALSKRKERLYIVFQLTGWGLLCLFQFSFLALLTKKIEWDVLLEISVQISCIGLLLTHFSRRLIERWQWKKMALRRLVPRLVATSFLGASALWVACYVIQRFAMSIELPTGAKIWILYVSQTFNGSLLFGFWYCFYFTYHYSDRAFRDELDRLHMAAATKQAELRALKSQLNPHFLFNSLNSLRALIDENPARAREAVTQLANLLRYSLQSAQRETVPFEDELRVVSDYLSLEQVRHEERLRVRIDVPEETLRWPIPPMLLQTLVENAVKYGISTRADGGEIGIWARNEGGMLKLRVTNPGTLRPSTANTNSTGLGLTNAVERLRILFGEKASLLLRADGLDTVVAEAAIPQQFTRG